MTASDSRRGSARAREPLLREGVGAVRCRPAWHAVTFACGEEQEDEEPLWPGFGPQYQVALLGLLRRHLALDPRHRLLCLGQGVAPVAAALQRSCSLLRLPFLWHLQGQTQLPPCQRALLLHPPHGDHQNATALIRQVFSGLEELGQMLLVHRPGSMMTLPFFEKARMKLAEEEYPYMKVLECLSELGAEVQWEIEHVPVITSKANWLSVFGRKGPPMPDTLGEHDIDKGLQELRFGCLRYIEDEELITFEDRLMFIRATKAAPSSQYPRICRISSILTTPHGSAQDIQLALPLTEDMHRTLEQSMKRKCPMKLMQ